MRFYLRILGISTVKMILLTLISVLDLRFVAVNVPVKVHALVGTIVLLLITFLFAEWMLRDIRNDAWKAGKVVMTTYIWETSLGLLLWSAILGDVNVLFTQTVSGHLIGFTLHTMAMAAAYFDVQRLPSRNRKSSTEGLSM